MVREWVRWVLRVGWKGEGTEDARRAREMVCWARVMMGGGYSVCARIDWDENYTALMSRSTDIAIVGRFD